MKKVLRINSSIFSEQSVSNQLMDKIVQQLAGQFGEVKLIEHDLAKENVPHLDAEWLTAIQNDVVNRSDDQHIKANYSDNLIREVREMDLLLLGMPMYNFGVSSALKAWFDHIARAGVTFRYTSGGSEGLLQDKKAIIVTTRGGLHRDQPSDTQVPFVKNFLQFIGIHDVDTIYVEGLNMGNGQREKGLMDAEQQIAKLLAA